MAETDAELRCRCCGHTREFHEKYCLYYPDTDWEEVPKRRRTEPPAP